MTSARAAFLRTAGDGFVEVRVRVIPGARTPGLAGVLGDRLKLRVAAPAEGGRANRAVVELLARLLGLAARDVEIVSGHSAREKTLRVRALPGDVEKSLAEGAAKSRTPG